jgi:hypothetical protein
MNPEKIRCEESFNCWEKSGAKSGTLHKQEASLQKKMGAIGLEKPEKLCTIRSTGICLR